MATQDLFDPVVGASNPTDTSTIGTPAADPNAAPPMGIANDPNAAPIGTADPNTPASDYTAPDNSLVSKRLLDLLDKDNPFITRAKTAAAQSANARGLQNSSMGVQAGEAAAIDAALPIAQGDAANFTQLYGNDQQAKNQADLYRLQGDITKGLNQDQHGFDMAKQDAQNVWENKFLQDKINLEKLGLGLDQKQMVTDGFNTIQSDFQKDWMEILLNPNFATPQDRQKALNDLTASTQSRIAILSSTYKVPLVWDAPTPTPIDATAPTDTPAETPAPIVSGGRTFTVMPSVNPER